MQQSKGGGNLGRCSALLRFSPAPLPHPPGVETAAQPNQPQCGSPLPTKPSRTAGAGGSRLFRLGRQLRSKEQITCCRILSCLSMGPPTNLLPACAGTRGTAQGARGTTQGTRGTTQGTRGTTEGTGGYYPGYKGYYTGYKGYYTGYKRYHTGY